MSRIRISRTIAFLALAVSLMLVVPTPASARIGIGFYGGYYGPFYPYGPWGYPYGPYAEGFYGYGPYGYGPYGRPAGEVHIKSPNGDAQIFINGSFAGRARDVKHIYLTPGTYTVEQRIGSDVQRERIYVLANRNVTVEFAKPGTARAVPNAPPNARSPMPEVQPEANPQAMPPPPPPPPDANTAEQPAPAPPPEARQ